MNFVEGNSLSAYARFGKMASSKTLGFLREKKEQFRSSFVSERMRRLLDDFDNSSRRLDVALLEDEIRVAKRREKRVYDDGHIKYISDILDIQHSNFQMRQLIMSDPELRRESRNGQIEGWSTLYKDRDEGHDGFRHRDFRRLNKNLYKKNDDGHYQAHHYYENHGADELTLTEKLDALRTIDRVKSLIKKRGEDPTSLNGGKLT